MKVTIVIMAAMLLFGSSAQSKHTELFGPDFLNGMRVEYVTPCNNFSCFVIARDDKQYLAVVNNKNETQYVYEIVGTRKKPILNLLWATEREWI